MRLLAGLLLIGTAAAQQTLHFVPVPREKVMSRLEAVPKKARDRGAVVRVIFEQAGCAGGRLSDIPVRRVRDPNIVCTSAGETDASIIVGAHYDAGGGGPAVADNWSGAALLASVYEAIAAEQRHHTFVFAAFSGEEEGLLGSAAFVKALAPEGRRRISLMLNLDTLGLSSTKVWLNGSDRPLSNALAGVARLLNVPIAAVNIERVGSMDSEPFRRAGIPVVSIHSVTQETLDIVHSPFDRLDAIRRDEYYDTYRLVVAFLVYCDLKLGNPRTGDGVRERE